MILTLFCMMLSIIIPVYNEEKTIEKIIKKVTVLNIPNIDKDIIIVNDASTDRTGLEIKDLRLKNKNIQIFEHKKNLGKGAAVKTGIEHAKGDYIIIQDADEEYNPEDIKKLVKQVKRGSEVVYGTRLNRMPNLFRDERTPLFLMHYLGNRFLSLLTSILYGQWITDMETGYKLFPSEAVRAMELKSKGFEFEPEISAKLMKKKYIIKEISISTVPREYKEGKKLNALRDGPKALWALIKYRFID